VNCGPQSNFLYIVTPFTLLALFTFTCINIILLPLDTLNPLFTANRWDWQRHRKLRAKYLFVLCAGFTLLLGKTLRQAVIWRPCPKCHEASKHHLLKFGSFSYWFDLPWFHNWGKTCCCAHHTFSWGSQLVGHLHQHRTINYLAAWSESSRQKLPCVLRNVW
jgi:hypothetical protein